jgi:hypothetical protein
MARFFRTRVSPGPNTENEVLENPDAVDGDAFSRHNNLVSGTSHDKWQLC